MDDEVTIQGVVGPVTRADGATSDARMDMTSATVVTNAHGAYTELSSRAGIYCASTAVGGVAPGTALSTTPPMALWNPPSSGKMLNILRVSLGYVSGTLGAGTLLLAQVTGQVAAPTTGARLTAVNNKTGATANCVGQAYQGSTCAGTPTILRPSVIMGAFVGGANNIGAVFDPVDGAISVAPGTVFAVQALAGAGTSPLALIAVEWEETPIPTTLA